MKKSDVEQRDGHPAVNVKVSFPSPSGWEVLARQVAEDDDLAGAEREMFLDTFGEYIESDPSDDHLFEWACESGWEMLNNDAREIFGPVAVWQEGRSGGWAVIPDLSDVEDWDAIELSKWARFVKYARAAANDIPYQMVTLYLLNDFERYMADQPSAASVMLVASGVGL